MENEETKEIRYFSMFSRVGGFELGLERASNSESLPKVKQDWEGRDRTPNKQGALLCHRPKSTFRCIGCSEIDKYASELLKQKFPTIKNYGDATKINPRELPDFDFLCGGFPCQAFSIAGKRKGFQDTRGTLFFEVARILKVKRPKIVLLENVKGLLNHEGGKTFRVIIQTLSELGYNVQWMVLNSKFFGVPQNRERVFIIGSLRGTSRSEILPFGETDQKVDELQRQQIHPTITQAIGRQGSSKEYKSSICAIANTLTARYEQAQATGSYIAKSKFNAQEKMIMDLYNNKEHSDRCPTLTDPCHNTLRVREGMKIRKLTPTECERLQGFPEDWTKGFSNSQRYKMMGNAVTVNVIKAIGLKIIESKKEEN